jgi:hypothetical protein
LPHRRLDAGEVAGAGAGAGSSGDRPHSDAGVAAALVQCADEIAKLNGYARKAASRRRVTMEALDCALEIAKRDARRRRRERLR